MTPRCRNHIIKTKTQQPVIESEMLRQKLMNLVLFPKNKIAMNNDQAIKKVTRLMQHICNRFILKVHS